jgi:hypothetical protein
MNALLEENQILCETARTLGHHTNSEETIHSALQWYIDYLKTKQQRTLWEVIQDFRNSPDFVGIENADEIFNVRSKETGREINL